MSLKNRIETATRIAHEQDETQTVGKISGHWEIVGDGDIGRMSQMSHPVLTVRAEGISAYDVMAAMEEAGIEGDQDWASETTTYVIDGDRIIVSGQDVTIE